jgi:allantoinase
LDGGDLLIRAQRVVTGTTDGPAAVGIRDGRFVWVGPIDAPARARELIEVGPDLAVMPGLVDTHVHLCEPGHTDWEGFASATRAAAAGGITTLLDMPIDSVPATTSLLALRAKQEAARGQCHVDVGFWAGITPHNLDELGALRSAGVFGFKGFLGEAGSAEMPPLSIATFEEALRSAARLGAPVVVHAESAEAAARVSPYHGRDYLAYLASRPRGLENLAIAQVIEAARWSRARVHIAHLSSSDAIPMIASARRDGLDLSAETCPHYLTISAEEIPQGGTLHKASPPIREGPNRDRLWLGIADGALSAIVSDHSPCDPDLKAMTSGDFGAAFGGISSLQLGLSLIWTEADRRGFSLSDVVRWMAEGPAEIAGLTSKGRIAIGADADFAIFAPSESFSVDGARLLHRHSLTPYEGRPLRGVVRATYLAGEPVDPADPRGRLLRHGDGHAPAASRSRAHKSRGASR